MSILILNLSRYNLKLESITIFSEKIMASQLIFMLQQENSDLKNKLAQMKKLIALLEFAQRQQNQATQNQGEIRLKLEKHYKKLFENKEGTYINEIKLLNDTLKQADQTYEILDRQYQQQRIFLKQSYILNQKLQQQIEHYKQQIKRIMKQKQANQSQILQNFNNKLSLYQQKYEKHQEKIKQQNKQLIQKIKIKEDLCEKNQAQFLKMKELLQLEINKRKIREKQYKEQIVQLQAKIIQSKNIEKKIKKELNDQIALVIEKDGKIKEMEKAMREMNLRVSTIEKEAEKKVMKEKIVAKKAMEGLQMVRKYSDMELNKSRKKERMYIMSQKELISKIKDTSRIETSDNSLLTIKSSRKVSLPTQNEKNKLNLSNFQRKQNSTLKLFTKNKCKDLNIHKNKYQSSDILDLSSISTREKHKNSTENETTAHETVRNEQPEKESPDVSKFVLEECSEIEIGEQQSRDRPQSHRVNHNKLIIQDLQLESPQQRSKENLCVQTPCFEDTVPVGLFRAYK